MIKSSLMRGNLFLYETEEQLDVKHVIVLQHFVTSLVHAFEIIFNSSGRHSKMMMNFFLSLMPYVCQEKRSETVPSKRNLETSLYQERNT